VVSEVALATLLLVGAGLLFKSFQNLLAVEPGFEPERVLTLELSPQHRGSYREQTISLNELHRRVERRLEEIPQVIAAGGSTRFPYMGEQVERSAGDVEIQGENDEASRHREPSLIIDITPRYFEAMGIPLLEGRFFNDGDGIDSPKVVIVSQRTAERLFPGRSALGRGIRFAYTDPPDPWGIIVGVVGNVKYFASESDSGLELYYPISQYKAFRFRTALRVKGDPESVIPQIREAVAEASPETAIADLAVMNDVIDDSLWQPRLWGTLLTAFATLALVLSALGVYGILSFSVSRWTREIGIRIALGAGMARIHGLVLGSGLRLVGLGLALGLAGSLLFGRSLASFLFGVSAYDPATLLAVTALLLLVAAAACLVPAFRASRIDPTEALRQE
jgi:predicted permease